MITHESETSYGIAGPDVDVQQACRIEDYALIGDCHASALVSRRGSLDWMCLPTFSSPSVFCALLDEDRGGSWQICPRDRFTSTQRYLEGTNVLRTRFETSSGVVELDDLLVTAAASEEELGAEREVLRIARCVSGKVPMYMHFEPRLDYGRHVARIRKRGAMGWQCLGRGMDSMLQTQFDVAGRGNGAALEAGRILGEGECAVTSWAYADREVCVVPAMETASLRYEATISWWRSWLATGRHEGEYGQALRRSALALKLMTSALTGGVVAAPTTSLPEWRGGGRNWDYRYCWVRDSAFAMRAYLELGHAPEGSAFQHWLLRAVRLPWSKLQVVYDLWGNRGLKERTLGHLQGFCGSRPVRKGNAASGQFQSDMYGELIAATADFVNRGGVLGQDEKRLLRGLGRRVCKLWSEPDHGIWEKRMAPQHHTFSKVMCWVAIEKLLQIDRCVDLDLDRTPLLEQQSQLAARIEQHGFNRELNSYVATFDGETVDASLLLMARHGYLEAEDPRMRGTFEQIDLQLSSGALVWRYREHDGLDGPEGSFLPCAFWAVEYLALAGRQQEARQRLDWLLGCATETGLFSEECEEQGRRLAGNFPQALTHESLIGAILALRARSGGDID